MGEPSRRFRPTDHAASVSAVLKGAAEEAARLLQADGAMIYLYDADANVLRFARDAGIRNRTARRLIHGLTLPVGVGMFGTAFARAELVTTEDYPNDAGFTHSDVADQIVETAGMRAMAVAPLVADGESLGALGVFIGRAHTFDPAQLGLLRALANHAAVTLANERLQEDLRRRADELARRVEAQRTLGEIAARITALRHPAEVLQEVVDAAHRLLASDGAHLTVPDGSGAFLRPRVIAGGTDARTRRWLASQAFPVAGGMNGLAASLGRAVWTEDYMVDPRIPHEADDQHTAERMGLRGMAVAPLRAPGGEILGTLAVSYRKPCSIDPEQLDLLQRLADQGAIALSNATLVEQIHESERRYRFLVEQAPDIIYEIDADGAFTFVSDAIAAIAGWEPDKLVGRPFMSIIAPESLDAIGAEWAAIVSDPSTERRVDFGLMRKGGGVVPVETRAIGIERDGAFVGVHGSTRDISERVTLENDLRRQTDELARRVDAQQTLSEIARQLTAMRDPAVILQRTVDEAARLLKADGGEMDLVTEPGPGLRLAHTFGRPTDAPPPDSPDLDEPDQGIAGRALIEGRVVVTGDYLNDPGFRHSPEADAWVRDQGIHSVLAAPLIGEHGWLGAMLMDAQRPDAWDADDAELLGTLANQAAVAVSNARLWAQVESSERRYRHLVENSPDTIWSARADGTLTYFSETIERLSGWKAEELVGKHFRILVHPDSGNRVNEEWQRMVDNTEPDLMIRFHLRHRDGHPIPAETTGIAEIVDGKVVGAHGAVRDISVRERLEVDLRAQAAEIAASQERGNLARELHDSVTQALFSMGLTMRSLELLLDQDPGAARGKLAELRDLQKDALAEMRTLIFELRPKSLEQDGLEQALRTHAAAVQGRTGLSVTVEADTGLPERLPSEAEETLYRIGQEALHNVVKHANASSARILLARIGGEIRLSVTDDGIGFDPANTPRGHLGLVGMRQRAERIGAEFAVTSRPGHGTAVSVTWRIPAESADETEPAPSAGSSAE